MFVEFSVKGILLRFLVILRMDVVQQKVAVGNDIAYIFCLLGIGKLKAVNDFLGAALDGFHILRVLPFRFKGNLGKSRDGEQRQNRCKQYLFHSLHQFAFSR